MFKQSIKFITVIAITFISSISLQSVIAQWQAPTANPPGSNIKTPINTGLVTQEKLGSLNIAGDFGVSRDVVIDGRIAINDATSSYNILRVGSEQAAPALYIDGSASGSNYNPELALGNGVGNTHWGIYGDKTSGTDELRFWKQEGGDVLTLDPHGNLKTGGNITTNGDVKANRICDETGANCIDSATIGTGGGGGTIGGGVFVGATTATYDGDDAGSYAGADAFCNAEYPGSRVCESSDFVNGIPNAVGWYNTFHTYTSSAVPSNDCVAWQSSSSLSNGTIFSNVVNLLYAGTCSYKLSYLCCSNEIVHAPPVCTGNNALQWDGTNWDCVPMGGAVLEPPANVGISISSFTTYSGCKNIKINCIDNSISNCFVEWIEIGTNLGFSSFPSSPITSGQTVSSPVKILLEPYPIVYPGIDYHYSCVVEWDSSINKIKMHGFADYVPDSLFPFQYFVENGAWNGITENDWYVP